MVRRAYPFKKGELHDVTEAHLERQLREAGYIAETKHEPAADPR